MLKLSIQRLVDLLLSDAPVQVFGQVLTCIASKAVADAIKQDEDEYASEFYTSNKDVLTDAYLMSGHYSDDIDNTTINNLKLEDL